MKPLERVSADPCGGLCQPRGHPDLTLKRSVEAGVTVNIYAERKDTRAKKEGSTYAMEPLERIWAGPQTETGSNLEESGDLS